MSDAYFGLTVVFAIVLLCLTFAATSRAARVVRNLLLVAILLRVAGAVARHVVIYQFYNGVADAGVYFNYGLQYADRFLGGDFSPFHDVSQWMRPTIWGTQFVTYPTAFVVMLTGPTILGAFIVFSLLAFLGLVGFAVAFRRTFPHIPLARYARWIWLFPSLWFWPSSIGKESLIMFGLGLAVWGFIGKRGVINWPLLAAGTFMIFAVRPPLAAVWIFSCVVAHWLPARGGWTTKAVLQGIGILALGFVGMSYTFSQMGIDPTFEGIQEYLETNAGAAEGNSAIEEVGPGISGIPMAIVNILMRPFIWEVGNLMMLFSALETLALWVIVIRRRRSLAYALRNWRANRLLRLAVIFIPLYSALIGMLFVNLGIIARQRVFIFPFLFAMLETAPAPPRPRPIPGAFRRGMVPGPAARPVVGGPAMHPPAPPAWVRYDR